MKRDIYKELALWKNAKQHLPILLRGARQVGKTYLIDQFGREHFENLIKINFELSPQYKKIFENIDPKVIIEKIQLLSDQIITPGKTLLFLDEIQDCKEAIMSLRYFKELMPELHVIAAGSLLEFALNESDFKMPVGRVQFFHMHPLSFKEFLTARGSHAFREYLEQIKLTEIISDEVHQRGLSLIKEYCTLGGMPGVLDTYLSEKSYKAAQDIQNSLLLTYQNDFGKYTKEVSIDLIKMLYQAIPNRVAQQFKYSHVSQDFQARELRPALNKLIQANIVHRVFATTGNGLPLNGLINEKKFKLLFLDVGLLKRFSNLDIELLMQDDLFLVNQGQLIEQLVGQELLSHQEIRTKPELFFWASDQKNAEAEVDYVITLHGKIIPIEVKSGPYGKLKSLQVFMEKNNTPLGIKISVDPLGSRILANGHTILSIPLYLIGEISRLLKAH